MERKVREGDQEKDGLVRGPGLQIPQREQPAQVETRRADCVVAAACHWVPQSSQDSIPKD